VLLNKCSQDYAGTGPYERCGLPPSKDLSEFLSRAIVDLRVGNCMTNKAALLVFYGLIIANVTIWVSLAVTML
jgi:hypothetical protein